MNEQIRKALNFIRVNVISYWYLNYLQAGWSLVAPLSTYISFITLITVYFGKDNPYYFDIVVFAFIAIMISLTTLGYFAFSNKGTRFHQGLKSWQAEPHTPMYAGLYEQIAEISKHTNTPLTEHFMLTKQFLDIYSIEQDGFRLIEKDLQSKREKA